MDTVVKATDLKKMYDKVVAVDGISFEVGAGETVGLVGPNGAGKTTTIHMLLGLLSPTAGEIEILGKKFSTAREYILGHLNFVGAQVFLPGNLTVKQNLTIFSMLYGQKPSKDKINELLAKFHLEKFAKQKAGKLSSGESARLNLAKAFINDPKLLLLDEPTASLDPSIAVEVRKIIKKQQEALGTAIVWTSHNMREIETVCDRVIFIHHGKILASGTPSELRAQFNIQDMEEIFINLAARGAQ